MKAHNDKKTTAYWIRTITFWLATGIIALETGVGAEWDLARIPFVSAVIGRLGYPAYILTIMGVWKAAGVIVLLIPGYPRIKEWVYAGLFFVYTGAGVSHLAVGEGGNAAGPFIFAALTLISWALRSPGRRDFGPFPAGTGIYSRTRRISYWIATAIIAFQLGAGGIGDLLRPAAVVDGMTLLGYPVYFCVILGVWKVGGAIAVLAPRLPRLKEWAYAGAVFDLTGAAASHFATGAPAGKVIMVLVFAGIALASWALRPPTRRDLAEELPGENSYRRPGLYPFSA
jgi:hypothetical protein